VEPVESSSIVGAVFANNVPVSSRMLDNVNEILKSSLIGVNLSY